LRRGRVAAGGGVGQSGVGPDGVGFRVQSLFELTNSKPTKLAL